MAGPSRRTVRIILGQYVHMRQGVGVRIPVPRTKLERNQRDGGLSSLRQRRFMFCIMIKLAESDPGCERLRPGERSGAT